MLLVSPSVLCMSWTIASVIIIIIVMVVSGGGDSFSLFRTRWIPHLLGMGFCNRFFVMVEHYVRFHS